MKKPGIINLLGWKDSILLLVLELLLSLKLAVVIKINDGLEILPALGLGFGLVILLSFISFKLTKIFDKFVFD